MHQVADLLTYDQRETQISRNPPFPRNFSRTLLSLDSSESDSSRSQRMPIFPKVRGILLMPPKVNWEEEVDACSKNWNGDSGIRSGQKKETNLESSYQSDLV
ncbi:hypothetical protein LINPERPRIM_LOCUS1504 [Linum perenne]